MMMQRTANENAASERRICKYLILRACWRGKPARWPHFLLHFFNVHTMNVNYTKF